MEVKPARHDIGLGFTLIELMVVIVLLGILTAMIIPQMRGTFEDALLRSASRELISVFNAAYSHAVSVNQVVRVRLDQNTGRYSVEKRVREDSFVPAPEVPEGAGALDPRISIEIHKSVDALADALGDGSAPVLERDPAIREPGNGITFYPDGTAEASEVVLRDRDGFRLALRINPVTASVHVVELDRK